MILTGCYISRYGALNVKRIFLVAGFAVSLGYNAMIGAKNGRDKKAIRGE